MRTFAWGLLTTAVYVSPNLARAETYEVGPDHTYAAITDVPLDALAPGDVVRVHWREEPYRERFGIDVAGTADAPISIQGVPSDDGELPVLDAEDSVEGHAAHVRGMIHISGDAAYIVVENFEIRNANAEFGLADNSAGVYAPRGHHLTFRNLDLHHNGNGFFSWHESTDVLVEGCHIHENGNAESLYEHNIYTESERITFQYNVITPLREGALGNNLKDRSGSAVIRYNWIEGGNRCLDLVEAEDGAWSYDDAADYVYGNILIKHEDTPQSQVIHYGGDNDGAADRQQLYVFHNTIYSDRPDDTTLLFVNADASVGAYNNVFHGSQGALELVDPDDSAAAVIDLGPNWITTGWFVGSGDATVNGAENLVEGADPGLAAIPTDFVPVEGSPAIDAGSPLPEVLSDHPVLEEFGERGIPSVRTDPDPPDLGAYGWASDPAETSGNDDETSSEGEASSTGTPVDTGTETTDGSAATSTATNGTSSGGSGTSSATSGTTTSDDTSTTEGTTEETTEDGSIPLPMAEEDTGCNCSTRPADRAGFPNFLVALALGALARRRRNRPY